MRAAIIRDLQAVYRKNQIGVMDFACPKAVACLCDCQKEIPNTDDLNRGIEAHVGHQYGKVSRIIVVSLDAGDCPAPKERTLEGRTDVIEALLEQGSMNPHMRGTTNFLRKLLAGEIGEDANPLIYYAMINSAKCSRTDGSMNMVPKSLHENCREFALQEIEALKPQVIWFQGATVKDVFHKYLYQIEGLDDLIARWLHSREIQDRAMKNWFVTIAREYLRSFKNGSVNVVSVLTPHPSDRYGRWGHFDRVLKELVANITMGVTKVIESTR